MTMHTPPKSPSDVPDSATTFHGSLFHEIKINNDGHNKNFDDDVDPLDPSPSPPVDHESAASDRSTEEEHNEDKDIDGGSLHKRPSQAKEIWKFRLRPADDDEPEDWWFASTAIPLLAATLGPMANVFSIAALVSPWRASYTEAGIDDTAVGYADPTWCVNLNIVSLTVGFLGNLFLLFNFTQAVRYIIALPLTIVLWFLATGILTSITICMHLYDPPQWPTDASLGDTYTEGFWYAVIASVLYFLCSVLLMINMLGYALGHYREHFELDDEQRNLILQTMMFFLWLAGGGGVFSTVMDWSYADALYFCDVTILTVGFGDFFPVNDLGRGLVFPYSVGGIIILGLVVSSISRFATQLGHDKVVKKKLDKRRVQTLSMTVTSSAEKEEREELERAARSWHKAGRPEISAPFDPRQRSIAFNVPTPDVRSVKSPRTIRSAYSRNEDSLASPRTPQSWVSGLSDRVGSSRISRTLTRSTTFSMSSRPVLRRVTTVGTKLKMLRDERDRFNEMRSLQDQTRQWKKYISLIMSVTAFSLLWCGGAVVFHFVEEDTYFEALYFCYVSLLTIGYGDLAPRSNPGKAFFVVWSVSAIPTMTILISNMGDTIIASYKRGTFKLGDWTLLPKKGFIKAFLEKHPRVQRWVLDFVEQQHAKERLEQGFQVGPDPVEEENEDEKLEDLAEQKLDEHDLAQRLVDAIRETADHLKHGYHKRYSYEEWVEYTRLIRFTQYPNATKNERKLSTAELLDEEEADEGIIEWDWIGEDSPMMADVSETEWVLDRLTESLDRYMKHQIPELKKRQTETKEEARERRRSTRNSGSITSESINRQMEEVGFSPVHLHAPIIEEGPRRRANSTQRRPSSPNKRRISLSTGIARNPSPGVAYNTNNTEGEQYFKPRPSAISIPGTSPASDTPTEPQEETQDSTTLQLPPFPVHHPSTATTIPDTDNDDADALSLSSHASSQRRHNSICAPGTPGQSSSQHGSGRRHTLFPGVRRKGAHGNKHKGNRQGSTGSGGGGSRGGGMESLAAMRLRRHQ